MQNRIGELSTLAAVENAGRPARRSTDYRRDGVDRRIGSATAYYGPTRISAISRMTQTHAKVRDGADRGFAYGPCVDAGTGENSDRCSIELECDCPDGWCHRLRLRFPTHLDCSYRRSCEVLVERLRSDIETALRAESVMRGYDPDLIESLEGLWGHLPFGIALITERTQILATNPEMDHMISDRRYFRPDGETSVLWPNAPNVRSGLLEAMDRVSEGLVGLSSVRLGDAPKSPVLDVRTASADGHASAASSQKLFVVTVQKPVYKRQPRHPAEIFGCSQMHA